VGRRNNSKPTIGNRSQHQDSKDNCIRKINISTSKNLDVKVVQEVRMREKRRVYMVLVGKPNGKSLLGKLMRRYEDNIKIHLQKVLWGHRLDWSGSG